MFKNSWWGTLVVALVGATSLLTPGTSEAQRRGIREGRRGERYENRGERFENRGYYRGWGRGGYLRSYPGYYDSGYYDSGTIDVPPAQQSNYPADPGYRRTQPASDPNGAAFVVRLPDPNAEVWFENYKTQQRGNVREYTSDSLDPNRSYTFHIRARWNVNGRVMDQTRDITARAGQQVNVDFIGVDERGRRYELPRERDNK